MSEDKNAGMYKWKGVVIYIAACTLLSIPVLLAYYYARGIIQQLLGFEEAPPWDAATIVAIYSGVLVTPKVIVSLQKWLSEKIHIQDKGSQPQNNDAHETQKLLVDGTKLLGNETSEAEKMAGLACLANIIKGSSSFAEQAADIVHSFIRQRVESTDNSINGKDYVINAALSAISTYSMEKKKVFNFDGVKFKEIDFYKMKMFSTYFIKATYENCQFMNVDVMIRRHTFSKCEFIMCKIIACQSIDDNYFYECLWCDGTIRKISGNQDQIQSCYYVDWLSPEIFAGYSFRPFLERPENAQPIGYQKTT